MNSAIRTDFILSIEIVIIALGSVEKENLTTQAVTVSIVSFLATIGVYGIVALIVRMDDAGYGLIRRAQGKGFLAALGSVLVRSLPLVIKLLGLVGTVALVFVAGGIFVHHIGFLHHLLTGLPDIIREVLAGLTAGLILVAVIAGGKKIAALFGSVKRP